MPHRLHVPRLLASSHPHHRSPTYLPRRQNQCLYNHHYHPLQLPFQQHANGHPSRSFHTSRPLLASAPTENFYTTLESTPGATPSQLKKQFYTLSKRYHPDLHPSDPHASKRFIAISTAWATLGHEAKRASYDRDLMRSDPSAFGLHETTGGGSRDGVNYNGRGPMPAGSHSSAQAYGARPASGLSRRRSQFRGPPPSFYRSGGWGNQEKKRRAASEGAEEGARRATEGSAAGRDAYRDSAAGGSGMGGGFSPGQGQEHAEYEVPHFDRRGHYRRQESVEEALKRRRAVWAERETMEREVEQSSDLARVVFITGSLIAAVVVGAVWDRSTRKKDKT